MATIEELEAQIAELKKAAAVPSVGGSELKLDLGCGQNKKEGFVGVDALKLPNVDIVHDLGAHTWPWEDNSVDEVNCSHLIEHLTWKERVFFFNELYRVMKSGAKAQMQLPHWASSRYYGDPTHQSPMSEWAWFYLNKDWRKTDAPHVDSIAAPGPMAYSCDFAVSYGYTLAPWCVGRDKGFVDFALQSYKEAAQDMIASLVKK